MTVLGGGKSYSGLEISKDMSSDPIIIIVTFLLYLLAEC